MDIQARTEAYIGYTVSESTVPTLDQLSQFCQDAIVDIVNKSIMITPGDAELFATTDTGQYNALHVPSGIVVNVAREINSDGDVAPATQIPVGRKSLVKDPNSIHYASKYNPVWYFDEGSDKNRTVTVLPATSNTAGEKYHISYVDYSFLEVGGGTVDKDTELDEATGAIRFFPRNRTYLIPLYCAIRSLYLYICSEFKGASDLFTAGIANAGTDSSVDTSSFAKWLSDEDTELAQITAQVQQGEAGFLMQYLQKLGTLKAEYMQAFGIKQGATEKAEGQGGRRE